MFFIVNIKLPMLLTRFQNYIFNLLYLGSLRKVTNVGLSNIKIQKWPKVFEIIFAGFWVNFLFKVKFKVKNFVK